MLGFAFFLILLPIRSYISKRIKDSISNGQVAPAGETSENRDYKNVLIGFKSTYAAENPVTKKEGIKIFDQQRIQYYEKNNQVDQEIVQQKIASFIKEYLSIDKLKLTTIFKKYGT